MECLFYIHLVFLTIFLISQIFLYADTPQHILPSICTTGIATLAGIPWQEVARLRPLTEDSAGILLAVFMLPTMVNVGVAVSLYLIGTTGCLAASLAAIASSIVISLDKYYWEVSNIARFRNFSKIHRNLYAHLMEYPEILRLGNLYIKIVSFYNCFREFGLGGATSMAAIFIILGGLAWCIDRVKHLMLYNLALLMDNIRLSDMEMRTKVYLNLDIERVGRAASKSDIYAFFLGIVCVSFSAISSAVLFENIGYVRQVLYCSLWASYFVGKAAMAWLYASLAAFYLACARDLENYSSTLDRNAMIPAPADWDREVARIEEAIEEAMEELNRRRQAEDEDEDQEDVNDYSVDEDQEDVNDYSEDEDQEDVNDDYSEDEDQEDTGLFDDE